MNVPPPAVTVLTSLPRALPPQIAAGTLAATLRHARRRRIRRRTTQAAGTLAAVGLAGLLALWGTNDFPAPGARPLANKAPSLNPEAKIDPGRPISFPSPDIQSSVVVVRTSLPPAQAATVKDPATQAPAGRNTNSEPLPARTEVVASASMTVPATPGSVSDSTTESAEPPPADETSHPENPPVSFVLVRTTPAETVRTHPGGNILTRPEITGTPTAPPSAAAPVSALASGLGTAPHPAAPGFTMVSTSSVPAPMVITTRSTVSPQSIATADLPHTPNPASDADLFAHAEGRPVALCRLNSGGTRWFWLDQPASGQF